MPQLRPKVAMVLGEAPMGAVSPPDGYACVLFGAGLESDWIFLQTKGASMTQDKAAHALDALVGRYRELLERRLILVYDPERRPVATACLLPGSDLGAPMEQVCWFAVDAARANREGMLALSAAVSRLYLSECQGKKAYLFVSPRDLDSIATFFQLGFEAYYGQGPDDIDENAARNRDIWQSVLEEIGGGKRSFPCDGENAVQRGPLLFMHDVMFKKSHSVKAFELSYPAQSGFDVHAHDYYQIWYVSAGGCRHVVEGQSCEMAVGDIFFIPPAVSHSTLLHKDSKIICCEFYLEELGNRNDGLAWFDQTIQMISFSALFRQELWKARANFTLSQRAKSAVEALVRAMLTEYAEGEFFFENYLQLQVMELLLTLAREFMRSPVRETTKNAYEKYCEMVAGTIRHIDQCYAEPLTLEECCRLSMVSKTYFCYIFKLLTRQTFVEYLNNLRVKRAMELLGDTEMSILEISQAVGYRDYAHFTRMFKRVRGESPSKYRASFKGR